MLIVYLISSAIAGLAIGYLIANRSAQRHILEKTELRMHLQASAKQNEDQKKSHEEELKSQRETFEKAMLQERKNAENILQELKTSYKMSLESMQAKFSQLAEETLKTRSAELKQANEESIANLVKPVREDLQKMQKSVDLAREHAVRQNASMDKTIEGLLRHTQEVERNAASLAQALQSNGKMQGDWGEQLLASILEGSGLRPGIDFKVQENLKDEQGNNHRPDVIINCPGNRSIIIDSKVSLTAYLNYTSAQTSELAETAKKENLRSVRAHIDELAGKQYEKLVPGALNQVLMFIPNEGSYILALRSDPQIGQYAYKKGIILINPTNLMLALQMIYNLWQTERQNKNTENIIKQATDLYDKVVTFVDKFDKIRTSISALQDTAEDAYKSLHSGKGNIVRRLEGLKQMGVTPKKKLPDELTDTLEDSIPEQEAQHTIE